MPIYLMKHPTLSGDERERERLVEATSIGVARNYVARGIILGEVAKPADLFRLAKAGAEVEKAGAEPEPAIAQPPSDEERAELERQADEAGKLAAEREEEEAARQERRKAELAESERKEREREQELAAGRRAEAAAKKK